MSIEGDTALTWAGRQGHTDVAKILLNAGADIDHVSNKGYTPLLWASRNKHIDTVEFLIEKGANIDAVILDGHYAGYTAFTFATHRRDKEFRELLKKNGALQSTETFFGYCSGPIELYPEGINCPPIGGPKHIINETY